MTIHTDPEGDDIVANKDTNATNNVAGKIIFNELTLVTTKGDKINLLPIFGGINLYENISSFAVSGAISIKDSQGLIEKFLITGGEELHIKISKPSNDILLWRQDFIVHKISKISVNDNLSTTFELMFTTKTFIRSLKRRLFKSFKNKSYADCVKEIYKEISDNTISVEDPKLTFSTPFISTGLNPHKAIEYITKRSCSKNKFFVCFERVSPITGTIDNAPVSAPHFFGSVDKLIEDSNKNQIYTIAYSEKIGSTLEQTLGPYTIRTNTFVRSLAFNHLDAMLTGFYNSKITTIDPITQTFNLKKYGYTTSSVTGDFYTNRLMTSDNFFSTYDDTKYELPGEKIVFSSYNDPSGREEWLSTNVYGQVSKNLFKIEVNVEGGTNNIGAGTIVNFKVPSHYRKNLNPGSSQIPDDIMYSGKYLVTAIRHTIDFDSYTKVLELSRGSFNFDMGTKAVNVTENTQTSKSITNITNKPKGTRIYRLSPDGALSDIISIAKNTIVRFNFLGNVLSVERNSSSEPLVTANDALNALGIRRYADLLPSSASNVVNISQLYLNILRRQPDTAGLNFWLTNLENGNITLAGIRDEIVNSAEALEIYGVNPSVLITSRSEAQIAKAIKRSDFSTIMEAVVYTYPGNLNSLTQAVYDKIKQNIQRLL